MELTTAFPKMISENYLLVGFKLNYSIDPLIPNYSKLLRSKYPILGTRVWMLLQLDLALLCTAGLLGVVATASSFEQQSTVHDVPRLSTVWANATYFVLIIGNRRGATTETAEHIGNHPCAASFNELVVGDHFPSPWDEYRKYKHGRSMARYLKIQKLSVGERVESPQPFLQRATGFSKTCLRRYVRDCIQGAFRCDVHFGSVLHRQTRARSCTGAQSFRRFCSFLYGSSPTSLILISRSFSRSYDFSRFHIYE